MGRTYLCEAIDSLDMALLSMLDRRYRLKTSKTPAQIAASKSGFTTVTDLDVKSTTNNTTLIGEKQND